ncbi:minor capsid protein [Streptococcus mitis]|uniref:Minor capsid protein n=1 Tax=Siphoviridae sp. ctzCL6 TaxID=2827978 RepID=A0A8S5S5Q0_9CAUD|nr:minor capsid protein [Streptococcus mitis]DAF46246.1 MAG TPA: minor capsid protein [Siphoviridae sp. ctzCL6]
MKNQEYWAKRKANLIYQQMDKAEKQADQFDKVYQEAKTYLDKEINKIFDKFQRDYGLSQVDAKQVLKNMKDKKDLNELRKVLEARPNDPNIQRLLADLDSPAYSFRMKRLERLSDDLDSMRESIYHSEKTGSDAFYSDLMKDSYYKATFDLQQQTGLAYGFSGLPESEIKHLQSFSWVGDGSTYSTDIWKNTGKLTSSIKDELLMSLMTGRDIRGTAQAIAERFNVGQNDARRLVRTESAFFHNQMELLSYEEADIEKYIFVAVLDKRTSRICQEHDNQVYDRDKAVPGVNCPPMHPWCRSTTVGYDEDADYSKLKRRARNPETGKVEYVPADMTYKEWYSKYVAKDGEKVYNQGMDRNKDPDKRRPVNITKQKELLRDFKDSGGFVWQDDQAASYLKNRGVDACCLDYDMIVLQKKPLISEILEELFHAKQFKDGLITDSRESQLLAEIEAQEYLISVASKFDIPKSEQRQTRMALEFYKQELKELKKHEK